MKGSIYKDVFNNHLEHFKFKKYMKQRFLLKSKDIKHLWKYYRKLFKQFMPKTTLTARYALELFKAEQFFRLARAGDTVKTEMILQWVEQAKEMAADYQPSIPASNFTDAEMLAKIMSLLDKNTIQHIQKLPVNLTQLLGNKIDRLFQLSNNNHLMSAIA